MELEVEQPAACRLEDVGPPAKVDSGSTIEMEGDHMAGPKVECRPSDTWVEHPSRPRQWTLLPLLLNMSVASVILLNGGAHKLV
jgi:hypothetical protein